jgi:ABC-type dipeptide/oligopeptide/nickel transport system permease subunit
VAGVDATTPWRATWRRFRRDRWALAAALVFAVMIVASFAGGPIASAVLGHNGTDVFPYATSLDDQQPVGLWTHVPDLHTERVDAYGDIAPAPKGVKTTLFILGADGQVGRDELIRLLDGGRATLEIGLGGAIVALLLALPLGCAAGYFGGVADALVGRVTETVMSFPLILFLIFASVHLRGPLNSIALGSIFSPGVIGVSILLGVFTCFYPMRLVRAEVTRLRTAEFVEAAEMVGASDWRIVRRDLLPHLLPVLLVWAGFAMGTNILLAVGISFVGVGVQPEVPTWGGMLVDTWGSIFSPLTHNSFQNALRLTAPPTVAVLVAVMALNLVADGVRRAIDPWAA